jgi:putative proteasome-type protease
MRVDRLACQGSKARGIQVRQAATRIARAGTVEGSSRRGRASMTYCLGITTRDGFVVASDSRSNAGYDQVNTCRKMHTFVLPDERVFVAMTSGSLSCSQSVVTLLRKDFDLGAGLASADSLYDGARIIGEQVRRVATLDREALERDQYKFNVNVILAGQIRGQPHDLYLIYPQGNPLRATEESPFLQIGECKYGRPILDRGVRYDLTSLEDAARYALISLDSTMRSNVTVGPPIDLLVYHRDELSITRRRRFPERDPDLATIHDQWEQALRTAVQALPHVRFDEVS